jgi:AcrR family transcriptional regulator
METSSPRQKEIISVSLDIIYNEGIQMLTMKYIGAKLGISDAALYKHFESKDDILAALVDEFSRISLDVLHDIENRPISSCAKVKAFFLDRCELFATNKAMAAVMFSEDFFSHNPRLEEKLSSVAEEHKSILDSFFEQGQYSSEIRTDIPKTHLFTLIIGTLRFLVMQWRGSNYTFDLHKRGADIWASIEKMISPL